MKRRISYLFYGLLGLCLGMMTACSAKGPAAPSEPNQESKPTQAESPEAELLVAARALKRAHPELFEKAGGVLVTKVLPDGQGAVAGLQPGDILLRYGDKSLNTAGLLIQLTGEHHTETKIVLVYLRGQEREIVEVRGGKIGVAVTNVDQTPDETMTKLLERGNKAFQTSQTAKALEAFTRGLKLADSFNSEKWRSIFGNSIGIAYNQLGNYPKALEYFELSLAIERALGDRGGEIVTLSNIGVAYYYLGNYPKALEYYEQSLVIKRANGDREGEGSSLNNIGVLYFDLGNYLKALEYHQKSLAIKRVIGDRQGEGESLNSIGNVYNRLGDSRKALEYHEQSLAIMREIGDRQGKGQALNNIGNVYNVLGDYPEALEYYKQTLSIQREIGDRRGKGQSLNNIGNVYTNLGDYRKALEYHEQSLAIKREIGDRRGKGQSLNNIGNVYTNLGDYPKALEYYEQTLILTRELGDRRGEGRSRNNIGNMYANLEDYPKALEYYEQASAIFREIGDRQGEGQSLNNIGAVYKSLGNSPKALEYLEQSLDIDRKIGDRRGEGGSLNNIGLLYVGQGDYSKALEYFKQALAIIRKIVDTRGEGESLHNIGNAYTNLGDYLKALEYYEQSLAVKREIGDRRGEGDSLNNVGVVYRRLGDYPKALEYYEQSLAVNVTVAAPESLWRVWNGLRSTLAHLKQPAAAILAGKKAINALQGMRATNTALERGLQQSFLKNKVFVYQGLAELLIDQGRLPEAQQVLAMLKEEEYHDFIRRDAGDDARTTRASLTTSESDWNAHYQRIAARLVSIGQELDLAEKKKRRYRSEEEQSRIKTLRADLDVASKAFQQVLKDLQVQFANLDKERYAELARRQLDVDLTGLVDELSEQIDGEVVLLHTLVLEDHLRLILTTGQVQKAYKVNVSAKALRHEVQRLQQVLQRTGADAKPAARVLYDRLIGPIQDDLKQIQAKLLMVSLDDALRYVPLAALYDGKQWLIERYALSVFTDAAKSNIKDNPNPEWRVAGLGLSQAVTVDDPTAKDGKRVFRALSAVPAELEGIVRQGEDDSDGVLDGELHLDQAFTLERLQDVLGEEYPVVHLASHFRFNPGTEKDSYLVLGEGKRLDLAELRQKHFKFKKVDLLTLSACETAIGGNGREVEGLAVTAQKAGAKGVLATLWPVADQSTGQFMQNLYRLRQERHLNKAEALRQAQLIYIRGEQQEANDETDYAHPYYWAPFILMGNWL